MCFKFILNPSFVKHKTLRCPNKICIFTSVFSFRNYCVIGNGCEQCAAEFYIMHILTSEMKIRCTNPV